MKRLEWLVHLQHGVSKDGSREIAWSEWGRAIKSAEAAIARSKGESDAEAAIAKAKEEEDDRIAASEDLLEALEDLRKELRDNPDVKIMTRSLPAEIGMAAVTRKADAAIAKAKS